MPTTLEQDLTPRQFLALQFRDALHERQELSRMHSPGIFYENYFTQSFAVNHTFNKLVKDFYDELEAYDKTVCSGTRHGIAMPVNHNELKLISINYDKTCDKYKIMCKNLGIDWRNFTNAYRVM